MNAPSPADPAGKLLVIATPIGNLDDVSPRLRKALAGVDVIAAEDTRRTAILLASLSLDVATLSYHRHNEHSRAVELLRRLERGERIGLVTDAGTPGVSDPGPLLVRLAHERHIAVEPVPGPSAVLAALSVSGFDGDTFVFAGYLPARAEARRKYAAALAAEPRTIIVFEVPHRIVESLADLEEAFGDRLALVARELTKVHEELVRDRLPALHRLFEERAAGDEAPRTRGEYTVVICGAREWQQHFQAPAAADAKRLDNELAKVETLVAAGLSLRDAVKAVAILTDTPRNLLYDAALRRRSE
ncbi:MAG: 16S rRNA (cytidine(1402)-2'-O)-methyltransferase [Candidatus Schekmanbacteria bacterium]|nr:16S rRNA (cytidine(1402)-2'-O)-methyltransferase [Candidatus Schekmanbacteria bacterium]